MYVALSITHTFSRTTGGTRWKPYVVRVWYNIHINACPEIPLQTLSAHQTTNSEPRLALPFLPRRCYPFRSSIPDRRVVWAGSGLGPSQFTTSSTSGHQPLLSTVITTGLPNLAAAAFKFASKDPYRIKKVVGHMRVSPPRLSDPSPRLWRFRTRPQAEYGHWWPWSLTLTYSISMLFIAYSPLLNLNADISKLYIRPSC